MLQKFVKKMKIKLNICFSFKFKFFCSYYILVVDLVCLGQVQGISGFFFQLDGDCWKDFCYQVFSYMELNIIDYLINSINVELVIVEFKIIIY